MSGVFGGGAIDARRRGGKLLARRKSHYSSSGTYRTYFNRELCEKAVAPEVSRERKDETEAYVHIC